MSKGTVSNWPSASMSHYCASARRELEGASQRSAIKAVAGAAAALGQSCRATVCAGFSLYLPGIISLTLLQRDVRFGAHCVPDYFLTDFQTLSSSSDSLCLHAFVFFKTCVTYTIRTPAKLFSLG